MTQPLAIRFRNTTHLMISYQTVRKNKRYDEPLSQTRIK
jgi:hypothetical protein